MFGDNLINDIMIPLEIVLETIDYVFKQISNVINFWTKIFEGDFKGAFFEMTNIMATSVNFIIEMLLSVAKVAINVADKISKAFGGGGFYDEAVEGLTKFAEGLKITEKQSDENTDASKETNEVIAAGTAEMGAFGKAAEDATAKVRGIGAAMPRAALEVPDEMESITPNMPTAELQLAVNTDNVDMSGVSETMGMFATEIENANAAGESFGNSLGSAMALLVTDAQAGKDAMKEMAQSIVSSMFGAAKAGIIAAATSSGAASGPMAAFVIPGLIGAGLSMVEGLFNAIAFADGGIVSGPTMGLVGEYTGARNNPEVIAPLDKLQSMLDTGGGNGGGTLTTRVKGNDLFFLLERAGKDVARNR
jgi:hypothetical protein